MTGRVKFIEHGTTQARHLCACLLVFLIGEAAVGADVIVVCPSDFKASARSWVDHRRKDGLSVEMLDVQTSPKAMRQTIRDRADASTRYVLLIGDAPAIGTPCDAKRQVPTHYLTTTVTRNWGSTPTLSTDLPYGQIRGDDGSAPQAAVGRLPVQTAQQLEQCIRRIQAYESSIDFGDWRQRIDLTAGIGGFGWVADTAIEGVTKAIITGLLPSDTKTCVAYASPGHRFCPTDPSFRNAVLQRYGQGCRFWVYAGHGWIDQLDRVPPEPNGVPVLDIPSVSKLNRPAQASPIGLMLACYTGAFDAPDECLAEKMVLHEGGPIACIAGSRVTMPYGNTTLSVGLINGIYHDRVPRLGDAWISTQTKLHATDDAQDRTTARKLIDALAAVISPRGTKLSDERAEHARLYNLLGDPTLRMHPPQPVDVRVQSGHLDGKPIQLSIQSPINGRLHVHIDLPLGTDPPEGVDAMRTSPGHWTVHQSVQRIRAGEPSTHTFVPSKQLSGPVVCRVRISNGTSWASGAATVILDPTDPVVTATMSPEMAPDLRNARQIPARRGAGSTAR